MNLVGNKVGKKVRDKKPLNSRRQKIITEMRDNPNITIAEHGRWKNKKTKSTWNHRQAGGRIKGTFWEWKVQVLSSQKKIGIFFMGSPLFVLF